MFGVDIFRALWKAPSYEERFQASLEKLLPGKEAAFYQIGGHVLADAVTYARFRDARHASRLTEKAVDIVIACQENPRPQKEMDNALEKASYHIERETLLRRLKEKGAAQNEDALESEAARAIGALLGQSYLLDPYQFKTNKNDSLGKHLSVKPEGVANGNQQKALEDEHHYLELWENMREMMTLMHQQSFAFIKKMAKDYQPDALTA